MIVFHGGLDVNEYGDQSTDLMLTFYDYSTTGKPNADFRAVLNSKTRDSALTNGEEFSPPMNVKVRKQQITKQCAIYCGDSCKVLPGIPNESVGFSIFSPPFAELYTYSDEPGDMGNCKDYADFFKHFKYLINELFRILMTGRVIAIHCMDLPTFKRNGEEMGIRDFPGDILRSCQDAGFIYHSRHTIWKDPLVAATRTKALGLAHKQIVKDSSMCRVGLADYVLAFRKPGVNPKPVAHPKGLRIYHGERQVPRDLESRFADHDSPKTDKRSHWIWQQYASPVWDDIRQTKVLPFRGARESDDEKHICPLQLDVIDRCLVLWSAPGDVVLTPFMGVGSEVYCAVRAGRKGIGVELKRRYFRQAAKNVKAAEKEAVEGFQL